MNLAGHSLVGRSASSLISLRTNLVSAEQAVISWRGQGWRIRDLGSANGTFVNDCRIPPSMDIALTLGDRVRFGSAPEEWSFSDDQRPALFARRESDGYEVAAVSNIVGLPSEESPTIQLYGARHDGSWVMSSESSAEAVVDGQAVLIAGEIWRVFLPDATDDTHTPSSNGLHLRHAQLTFSVSPDEETVIMHLRGSRAALRFESRAENYLLLHLARLRLRDIALAEQDQGWVDRKQLAESLKIDNAHANVQIFRLRKTFESAGIHDAGNIVEARGRPGLVRLGLRAVTIETTSPL